MSEAKSGSPKGGEIAADLAILVDGRKEKLAIEEDCEIVVTGTASARRCAVRRGRSSSSLRAIDGSLLLLVIWSEVLGRVSAAVVRPPSDGPVV